MTLFITLAAAIAAAVIWLLKPEFARKNRIGFLALMYFGAAIMWTVDGFAALAEGEPFVELSDAAVVKDDALLGLCVVVLGILIWGIYRTVKNKFATQRNA
ncbi:MAG: hypothetical protein LBR14_01525 [Clostridiales Family XIII bacterium]|jgi:hypothetical protein|nr:hypothetical protein [Clostridiales Family XIII bacterium]